jgi:hypothetical protein
MLLIASWDKNHYLLEVKEKSELPTAKAGAS